MLDGDNLRAILTAIFFEEKGGITGFVEEFIDVSAHGRNLKEARSRLTDAIRKQLEDNRASVRQLDAAYGTVTRERLIVDFRRE